MQIETPEELVARQSKELEDGVIDTLERLSVMQLMERILVAFSPSALRLIAKFINESIDLYELVQSNK